ncbi:hypothetical protein R3W88_009219 [Solanum pinnatisectum]|uniref:F-box domain-containing protein n=1 Tax=Solanum pinnatisectum TaxID=50273 RepID=A0AAV9MB16_9SOLN|nr:hypothetical protein R3W88_009219 [Solanum pinnatisectum]
MFQFPHYGDDELFLISQTVEDIPKNSVDLTLQLPDHLLHSIFSYFSFHDLLNISLVSKNWHRNIPSYLAFHFNQSLFHEQNPIYYTRDFRKSVLSFLCAFKNKLFNAEKRVLCILFFNDMNIRDTMKLLDGNDFHEEVIKKLYGRGDRTCCAGTHDKCWRHFLKHFEVKEEEEEKIGQSVTLSSSPSHPWKVKIVGDGKKYKLTKLIFIFAWQFNS